MTIRKLFAAAALSTGLAATARPRLSPPSRPRSRSHVRLQHAEGRDPRGRQGQGRGVAEVGRQVRPGRVRQGLGRREAGPFSTAPPTRSRWATPRPPRSSPTSARPTPRPRPRRPPPEGHKQDAFFRTNSRWPSPRPRRARRSTRRPSKPSTPRPRKPRSIPPASTSSRPSPNTRP